MSVFGAVLLTVALLQHVALAQAPTEPPCCTASAGLTLAPGGSTTLSLGVCSSYANCPDNSLWDWYGVPFYNTPDNGCCRDFTVASRTCDSAPTIISGGGGQCMRKEACPSLWTGGFGVNYCKITGFVCCKKTFLDSVSSATTTTTTTETTTETTTPTTTPTTTTETTTETTTPTTTTETTTETTTPTTTTETTTPTTTTETTTETTTPTTTTETTTETTTPTTTTESTTETTTPTTTTETTTETTTPTTTTETTTETTTPTTTTETETTTPTTTTETTTEDVSDEPTSVPSSPAPTPSHSCGCRENPFLRHSEVLALFNASGIVITLDSYYPGCVSPVPGCLCLDAIRSSTVLAIISLFEGKNCPLALVEGREPGHDSFFGLLHTRGGHVLGVRSSPCVDQVVRLGTALTLRGFSRSCTQSFGHATSVWCRTTGNVWLAACQTWTGIDRTREPFECGDNETLSTCVTTVNSLQYASGAKVFEDDEGYLLRHGNACPCQGTTLRAGGPFTVSPSTFAAVQAYVAQHGDLRDALAVMLNEVDFTELPYQSTSACLISALTVRLDLLRRAVDITDVDEEQLAVWQSFSPPCSANDFTKAPPEDTSVCRSRIGLVLDSSANMGSSNFNSGRNALRDFARSPKLSANSLISLVTFGTNAQLNFNWTTPSYAGNLIPLASYLGGWTYTHIGMSASAALFPSTVTNNELPVMIVVTNGRSSNSAALTSLLNSLPSRILRYAVGVGSRVSTTELRAIAGSSSRTYRASSFSRLPKTLTKLITAMCAQPRPRAPPPPQACTTCQSVSQLIKNERRQFTIPVSSNGLVVVTLKKGAGCATVYVSTQSSNPGPSCYQARATTCAGRGFGSSLSLSTRGWGMEFWKLRIQRWLLTGALPGPDEFSAAHGFRAQDASSAPVYAVAVAEEVATDSTAGADFQMDVEEKPAPPAFEFERVLLEATAAPVTPGPGPGPAPTTPAPTKSASVPSSGNGVAGGAAGGNDANVNGGNGGRAPGAGADENAPTASATNANAPGSALTGAKTVSSARWPGALATLLAAIIAGVVA